MGPQLLRVVPAHVFIHSAMTGTRLAAPLLALQQGHGVTAVGVLISLFFLSQVLLALPAGRYADRRGLRAPMRVAVLTSAVGCAIGAVAPGFGMLCVSALMTGGATGISSITLQRHVGRAANNPAELRQVFSWLAIGPAAANFLGPLAAGLLIDHAASQAQSLASFQLTYAVMALFPVVSWLFVKGATEVPRNDDEAATKGRRQPLELLRDAAFRKLLFINLLQQISWDVHAFAVPLLGHERGLAASVIGSILAAFALATAAVRLALPLVASRVSEHRVIRLSMFVTACLLLAYPFLQGPWTMGLCSALLGAALGAVHPMVMSMLHQNSPQGRQGEVLGLRLMAINASSVVMPLLFGALGGWAGVGVILWLVGGGVLAGALGVRTIEVTHAPPAKLPGQVPSEPD